MKILIAADIFGDSETQRLICQALNTHHQVCTITPYDQTIQCLTDENTAYAAFVEAGGMEHYIAKIGELAKVEEFDLVIGFSAGGAALWAAQRELKALKHGVAFYPGQIRHYLSLNNTVPWQLVFASHEAHFDQTEVQYRLIQKTDVAVYTAPYAHGFINQDSTHFNAEASACLIERLVTALSFEQAANLKINLPKSYKKFGKPNVTD